MVSRALAVIDQAVGQRPVLQRAFEAGRSRVALLGATSEESPRTPLPAPSAVMDAVNLPVAGPGAELLAVHGVSFAAEPGQAIGIEPPSASGKSSQAKALAGVWSPAAGRVMRGGAALDQYSEEALAHHVGWLPEASVARVEPSPIGEVEFEMEQLGNLRNRDDAKRVLDPLVRQYRDWIDRQRALGRP